MIVCATQVVLESVRNIEKCLKLKLAPKDPRDFEILVCCVASCSPYYYNCC